MRGVNMPNLDLRGWSTICFAHNSLSNSYYNVNPKHLSFIDKVENFEG